MSLAKRRAIRRNKLRVSTSIIVIAASLGLAGCNAMGDFGKSKSAAIHAVNPSDPPEKIAQAADYWTKRFAENPKDKTAAINLSIALRTMNKKLPAVLVMRQAQEFHPNDTQVLGALGKALADAGQMQDAANVLQQAQAAGDADWRLLSAYGTVLDQMRRHRDAQESYSRALALAPNEPSIMSNMGLSYALDRRLPEAEAILRKAAAHPQAPREAKENLALVLGLQGKFTEAEAIARATLPADAVAGNTTYLKQMMSQPANWAKLQALDAKNVTGSTQ